MKICFVLPHFYPYIGGGEKLFYDFARGLSERGHEVRVVARNVGKEYLGYKKIGKLDVYYCQWKSMFGHPIPHKKDIVEHIKWCDVVHTSIFTPAAIVSRLARIYKKPSVMTVHEVRGEKWFWVENAFKASLFWIYEQYVCRQKYDVYHAVSEATKRDYLKYCGRKNVVRVYNAVSEMDIDIAKTADLDLYQYFGIEETDRVFLYYGRPGKTKGVDIYRNALIKIKNDNPHLESVKFCFVLGAEPVKLHRRFEKSMVDNELSDMVVIKDSVARNNLCKFILQADYVVVPSVTEGFGLSALEACQMDKKIIYSDGGALKEVVYGPCLCFENRNSDQLAEHIQSVIDKGNEAFKLVPFREFPFEDMIDGIEDIYHGLLKK